MRMNGRLRRLEEAAGVGRDEGCPACRHRRGLTVLVRSRRRADGTTAPSGEPPAPCPRCGEAPERIIEIVEVVVESRADVAALAAEGWTGSGGA